MAIDNDAALRGGTDYFTRLNTRYGSVDLIVNTLEVLEGTQADPDRVQGAINELGRMENLERYKAGEASKDGHPNYVATCQATAEALRLARVAVAEKLSP